MKQLVISVIGKDSPGLVNTLSDLVLQHQGNWLGSSLTQLAGQFAGIIQVSIEDVHRPALLNALQALPGFHIHAVEGDDSAPSDTTWSMTVSGNDRQGIVNQVTQLLTERGINISKLTTETQSAPNWGYPLFYAHFVLDVAKDLDPADIQTELEQLADDLTIDFE